MSVPVEGLALLAVGAALWWLLRRDSASGDGRGTIPGEMSDPSDDDSPQLGTSVNQDHDFLLSRCNGDESELLRRLEAETRRNPGLSEAEVYRKAIRTWFVEKRGGTHGAIAEELDDTWL